MQGLVVAYKTLEALVEGISNDPFIHVLPDGILVTNAKKRVVYINEKALEMLNARREKVLGRPCSEVLQSEVCKHCRYSEHHGEMGENEYFNIDVVTQDGRTIACCMHTTPIKDTENRILGFVENFREMGQIRTILTEQERLINLYNYEKEKAKRLLNSIGDGVFTVGKDLRIRSFSPRLEELTGWKEAKVLGKPCSKILRRREQCPERECPILWVIRGGLEVRNHQHPIRTASGESIPISLTTAPMLDQKGDLIGAIGIVRDTRELEGLKKELASKYSFSNIIGRSAVMERVFDLIERIADTKTPVLIQGESGTGKELVAKALHFNSSRSDMPFLKINCSALPDPLLESELFGYEKGAFTGATRRKPGKFKVADGGTIFLDEIGETSPAFQAKLLRVVQDQEFEPLGGTRSEKVDVRILTATHRDLKKEIAAGRFREDLYYRICVVPISLPPLRERKEDIPLLIQHFLGKLARQYEGRHSTRVTISPAATRLLIDYDWPGNIRELENTIERAYVCSESGVIDVESLPREITGQYKEEEKGEILAGEEQSPEGGLSVLRYKDPQLILEVLKKYHGNRTLAAKALGISRTTLWRKIREIKENPPP